MSDPVSVSVAREAMATRFEIVLHGDSGVALRAAGEEALEEIQRLESQLSLYQSTSELSYINARAACESVRVEPGLFRLLQLAKEFSRLTDGAFDVTVAPLMRCWGFMGGTGRPPAPAELAEARARVGMHLVELNAEEFTIRFARAGVMLDLGSIGKGYALERAAELLIEAGVTSAILHGGTSTVCAIGAPPDAEAWKIAIPHPDFARPGAATGPIRPGEPGGDGGLLSVVLLKDEAMSVSAVWGKSFEAGGRVYGHVMDPRQGEPVQRAVLAAVVSPSATASDALSTALLTLGEDGLDQITGASPGIRALVASQEPATGRMRVGSRGIEMPET